MKERVVSLSLVLVLILSVLLTAACDKDSLPDAAPAAPATEDTPGFADIAGTWSGIDLNDELVIDAGGGWVWYNGPASDKDIFLEGKIEIKDGKYVFMDVDLGDSGVAVFDLKEGFFTLDDNSGTVIEFQKTK